MHVPARFIATLASALICSLAAFSSTPAAEEPSIVAQDLNKLRVYGKVGAVLWTIRRDICTLQVVPPSQGRVYEAVQKDPKMKRDAPDIQVWLLKADGTVIAPMWRTPKAAVKTNPNPGSASRPEITFKFPLSARGEAVAAAMMIDGEYYIDRLTPVTD